MICSLYQIFSLKFFPNTSMHESCTENLSKTMKNNIIFMLKFVLYILGNKPVKLNLNIHGIREPSYHLVNFIRPYNFQPLLTGSMWVIHGPRKMFFHINFRKPWPLPSFTLFQKYLQPFFLRFWLFKYLPNWSLHRYPTMFTLYLWWTGGWWISYHEWCHIFIIWSLYRFHFICLSDTLESRLQRTSRTFSLLNNFPLKYSILIMNYDTLTITLTQLLYLSHFTVY